MQNILLQEDENVGSKIKVKMIFFEVWRDTGLAEHVF